MEAGNMINFFPVDENKICFQFMEEGRYQEKTVAYRSEKARNTALQEHSTNITRVFRQKFYLLFGKRYQAKVIA